ncbi:MAG: hypothetical protein AABX80_02490 [Nanoarchaeota archaeon]
MEQHYNYLIERLFLNNIEECSETLFDESLKLTLFYIYNNKDYKKIGNLVYLLTNFYFKNGPPENDYLTSFNNVIIDLEKDYEKINKKYFNENDENMKDIRKFYQDSIKEYGENN